MLSFAFFSKPTYFLAETESNGGGGALKAFECNFFMLRKRRARHWAARNQLVWGPPTELNVHTLWSSMNLFDAQLLLRPGDLAPSGVCAPHVVRGISPGACGWPT